MKRIYFLFLFYFGFLITSYSFSLKADSTYKYRIDSNYVQSFKTQFRVQPRIRATNIYYHLNYNNDILNFNTYFPTVGGLTLTLWNFDLSFSLNKTKAVFNKDFYSQSNSTDLSFNYHNDNMIFLVTLRNNSGFYKQYETHNNVTGLKRQSYSKNFNEQTIGVDMLIITNRKKFSYKAAMYNGAIQKKSAGSFLFAPVFKYMDFKAVDSAGFLLEKLPVADLQPFQNSKKYSSAAIYPKFGYGYTFVKNKFYISVVSMGAAWWSKQKWEWYDLTTQKGKSEEKRYKFLENTTNILSGVNWPKWYVGIYFSGEYMLTSKYSAFFSRTMYNAGIFGGYRIIKYKNPNWKKKKKGGCLGLF